MTIRAHVAEPGVTSGIRLRVGEDLADELITPATIFGSDLLVWFSGGAGFYEDAEMTDPCEDGDTIIKIEDFSGNDYHATRRDTDTPLYDEDACNEIGGALLDSNDGFDFEPDFIPADEPEIWIYFVAKKTDTANYRFVWYYNRSTTGCWQIQFHGSGLVRATCNAPGEVAITGAATLSDYNYCTIRTKEDDKMEMWVNGVWKSQAGLGAYSWYGPSGDNKNFLGRATAAGIDGTLVEYFVVKGDNGASREAAESYIASKYSL